MIIRYIDPLSRAWRRMKHILFTPFDLGKWFALGFTAFLAGLLESPAGGGNFGKHNNVDWHHLSDVPRQTLAWISEHPFGMAVIIAGLLLAIVLWVVLTWLSSRGAFMFLDNVVHNRSLIAKPWRDFKDQADSLFLWRLALGFATILVVGILIASFFVTVGVFVNGTFPAHIFLIAGLFLIGFALLLSVVFISKLISDFVVPIMYKYGVSVNDGWDKFQPLFLDHVWEFILYGLFVIGLSILVGIGVALGGFLTCCCGFILLIIPYIGSVLMLPVSVTLRAFSLEFLEQFGEEYKIFPVTTVAGTPTHGNEDANPAV